MISPGCSSPENPPMRTTGARKFLVPSRRPARCEKRCNCCNGCFDTAPVIWTSKTVIPKTAAFGPACCTRLGSAPPLVRIAFRRLRIGVMLMRLFDSWAQSDPPCCGSFVKRWPKRLRICVLKMRPSCVTGSVRSRNWTIGRSGPKMACSGNRKSRCSAEIQRLRSNPCSALWA